MFSSNGLNRRRDNAVAVRQFRARQTHNQAHSCCLEGKTFGTQPYTLFTFKANPQQHSKHSIPQTLARQPFSPVPEAVEAAGSGGESDLLARCIGCPGPKYRNPCAIDVLLNVEVIIHRARERMQETDLNGRGGGRGGGASRDIGARSTSSGKSDMEGTKQHPRLSISQLLHVLSARRALLVTH